MKKKLTISNLGTNLSDFPGRLLSLLLMIFCGLTLHAQTIDISGQVTDKNTGEPLMGVNVVEKGTLNGVATNVEGFYSLESSESSVLVFSFIGYKSQEVKVAGRHRIDIQMEESANELEELVIVGYGKKKKRNLKGPCLQ